MGGRILVVQVVVVQTAAAVRCADDRSPVLLLAVDVAVAVIVAAQKALTST